MTQDYLKGRQLAVIERNALLGLKIKEKFPLVARCYREGTEQSQIVIEHGIDKFFDVSHQIARQGTRHAIAGYKGSRGVPKYIGLIPSEEELRSIRRAIRSKNARRTTAMVREKTEAYFVRDLTTCLDEHDEIVIGWSSRETLRLLECTSDKSYLRGSQISNIKIANTLNEEFHNGKPIRYANCVSQRLIHLKKQTHILGD